MTRLPGIGLLVFLAWSAWAQEPREGMLSLQGIVAQKGDESRIAGAAVELREEGCDTVRFGALTDSDGRFVFPALPTGRFRLSVTSPGHVPAEYGQRHMNGNGLPVILFSGQQLSNVRIDMVPMGAVSGEITDSSGRPVIFADVFILKSSYQEGERLLTPVLSAKTDDRGQYRIFWITPGTYYMAVIAPDVIRPTRALIMNAGGNDTLGSEPLIRTVSRQVLSVFNAASGETYAPVYFANTTDFQQAQFIDIQPGSNIKGVNLTVEPVRTFGVSGIVSNNVTGQFPGSPATMLAVLPFDPFGAPNGNIVNPQTGRFQMGGLVPGRYMVYAAPLNAQTADNPNSIWGAMEVEIHDQDIGNLNIVAKRGVSLSGKVLVEGQPDTGGVSPAAGLSVALRPQPLIGTRAPSTIARVSPDGTFSLPGVIEGTYRPYVLPLLNPSNPDLMNGAPDFYRAVVDLSSIRAALRNAYVKSIRVGEMDVLEKGFRLVPNLMMEIVIGKNAGTLNGQVIRMEDGKPTPAYDVTVGVVPDSNTARGFRTDMHRATQTDAAGLFQLRGLPPGDYLVFAWEDADKDSIMDLDFIRKNEDKGTRVRIDEGDRQNIELEMIRATQ